MMKSLELILLFFLISFAAASRSFISGTVSDTRGEPLDGAVVRVSAGGKTKAYGTTRGGGRYSLTVADVAAADSLVLSAQYLGYKKLSMTIAGKTAVHNLTLMPSDVELKEVTVSAAKINQRGDTLSYNLGSFLGKSDITLEDGLKKLPGVEVESSGSISYQGKAISGFYIEGMDMLGGKYNLATRSMPADYVGSVEIIERHNEAKIDKGKQSDKVALNLKLKRDVKFKPVGTTEGALGYSDKLLFRAGAAGMMFTPTFQTMMNVKAGNIEQFAAGDLKDHIARYSSAGSGNLAADYAGDLSGSRPPLDGVRYVSPLDVLVSVNGMKKTSEDVSLKANASYGYSDARYSYNEHSSYFAGDGYIVFEESDDSRKYVHTPSFEVNYRLNADDRYIGNRFSSSGEFADNRFDVVSERRKINQRFVRRKFSVSDDFSWRARIGRLMWNFGGEVGYASAPSIKLSVHDRSETTDGLSAFQRLNGDVLDVKARASSSYSFRNQQIYFFVNGKYARQTVTSVLEMTDDVNRVRSNSGSVVVEPVYEYNSPDRRFELNCRLPIELTLLHALNHASGDRIDYDKWDLNPSVRLIANINSSAGLILSASLNHNTGDALQLMTAPVMTDYRNSRVSSGIMMKSRNFNSSLRFDFKRPLDYWWVTASVGFNDVKNNVLSSLLVSDDDVASGALARDNTSQSLTSSVSVTKHVPAIRGKFRIAGTYNRSRGEMMQQRDVVTYHGQSFSVTPGMSFSPWSFTELTYNCNFVKTYNRYLSVREAFDVMTHRLRLSVYPVEGMDIFGESEFMRRKIQDGSRKNVAMFDVGVSYRLRNIRMQLRVDNVLDMRRYYYTVYTGLDTHSYSYNLRPRTFVFSITFTR